MFKFYHKRKFLF